MFFTAAQQMERFNSGYQVLVQSLKEPEDGKRDELWKKGWAMIEVAKQEIQAEILYRASKPWWWPF